MRTHETAMKGSEKGASSLAIEAAVSTYLFDPLQKSDPFLPAGMAEALLALVDGASCEDDLLSALDCAAIDPALRGVSKLPLPSSAEKLWQVGKAVLIARESVRFTIGARAANKLEQVGLLAVELAQLVSDGAIPKSATGKTSEFRLYNPKVPVELNQAIAAFHIAHVAELCIFAASTVRRKKLPAVIGRGLVNAMERGLSEFMPWLLLDTRVTFTAETRAKLPRLNFIEIFERHHRRMSKLDALHRAATTIPSAPKARRRATSAG